MPRAIWSGSISFGLLNVPVKLYSAVARKQVSFRELRASDKSRIRHRRVAESDGEEVPYEEIVKGYEIGPEQYVVLTREELEEMDPKKTRAIEIQDFVDLEAIDPIYFDHPYYLGPDKGSERAYALLARAMADRGRVAIARFVLRNREHLAAIRSTGEVLAMATMRFADEVVKAEELDGVIPEDAPAPNERELEMAEALIDQLTSDFEPDRYRDEYREELLALIESKARGEEVVEAVSEEPKATKAPDLMAALEESLQAIKGEPLAAGAKGDGGRERKRAPAKSRSSSRSSSPSLARRPQRPTMLVFDLDPGAPADILDCCRVGLRLRDLFDRLGLECYPKTSGSKGLQVYVPLNTTCTYDDTKSFARAVAQALERDSPDAVVSKQKKDLRKGKVLVDWSQNDAAKTTVAVYSLRARERPWVSAPVDWDEVEAALRKRKRERGIESLRFESRDVVKRVGDRGDLFAPVLTRRQKLPRPSRLAGPGRAPTPPPTP